MLFVDALLRNAAPFRQRFPALELRSSNMQQELVANRLFHPHEYLSGELRGIKYIPARTEVRLSLAIVDPGAEAMGYNLLIHRSN